MKALVLKKYGGNDSLEIIDTAVPDPSPKQVLIKVHAAGLNPLDYKLRQGMLRAIKKLHFPHIMGNEVSGVVSAVGEDVSQFKVGDRVYGRLDKDRMGGFAEFVAEDAANVALAPNSIGLDVAAGIPLVALTAWQCLYDVGRVKVGDKVLVHGGAGSVGRFALQFAKQAGAEVTTTGSAASEPLVRELGADHFINYRSDNFEASGPVYDMVLDLVGGETLERSFSVVKPGGKVISIAGLPEPQTAVDLGKGFLFKVLFFFVARKQLVAARRSRAQYRYMFMRPDGETLGKFAQEIDASKLKAFLYKTFDFASYAEAFDLQESGKAKGKIVIKI